MPTRRERVWSTCADEIDALVVTHLPSVRYLTGYIGSNGIAVITGDTSVLVTDARYDVAARKHVDADTQVVIGTRDLNADVVRSVQEATRTGARIAVEAPYITLARAERLREDLKMSGRTLVGRADTVGPIRAVKDADEIAFIRESAAINDRALARVLERPLRGRSERQIAWDILSALRDEGAEGPSFDVIVAAGANGALPHAVPTDAIIEDGTLVVIDMGAVHEGYCSDMTRTIVVGQPPDALCEAYEVCRSAQEQAVAAVRAGVGCGDLDAVARDIITAAGHGEHFGHGLGHGVGLEIHEAPRLGRGAPGELASGMVVTIEPGIYLEGQGGVRIEDLVVVTEDGPDVISTAPIPRIGQ